MKCFECDKKIDGLRSFLPLDKPYVNLPFHRDCYTDIEDELAYVTEHYERIMQYIYDSDAKPLRKRTKRK